MICPECKSGEVLRIGLYLYQCEVCGDVFDCTEAEGFDDNDYPDEEEDEDYE